MKSIIKHVSQPFASELYQAHLDHAHITGQEIVERPWWYENINTTDRYHDIYGCIGWPSEVSDKDRGMPGYVGVYGVNRPGKLSKDTHYDPRDAKFVLLEEAQSSDVPTLLDALLRMRVKYGFGINRDLMRVWIGDPERFSATLAMKNERLIHDHGENHEILISPPDDFYVPRIFDTYVRSLDSALRPGRIRLYWLNVDGILKTRIGSFRRDDPCILAVGGLIHTLLNRCLWMNQVNQSTIFTVEEAI